MADIYTIGNFTTDNVILYPESEMKRQMGGAVLFSAIGARLWSESVGIISVVSSEYPDGWLQYLEEKGIDINGVRKSPSPEGMEDLMIYDRHGNRTNHHAPNRYPSYWTPQQIAAREYEIWKEFSPSSMDIAAAAKNAKGIHICPMPMEYQRNAIIAAGDSGVNVIDIDPAWWPANNEGGVFPEMESSTAVLPSEAEIFGYFGETDPLAGTLRMAETGCRFVVTKIGSGGSIVYEKGKDYYWRIPVYSTKALDPTGAGDAFGGGFLAGFRETEDSVLSALYGTVSASFVIESSDALYGLGFDRKDAELRLAGTRNLVKKISL